MSETTLVGVDSRSKDGKEDPEDGQEGTLALHYKDEIRSSAMMARIKTTV
jgi:hypothetical protein